MTFKKFLEIFNYRKNGQSSLEYVLIFSILILLTLISFTTFFPKVQDAILGTETKAGFFQSAANRMTR